MLVSTRNYRFSWNIVFYLETLYLLQVKRTKRALDCLDLKSGCMTQRVVRIIGRLKRCSIQHKVDSCTFKNGLSIVISCEAFHETFHRPFLVYVHIHIYIYVYIIFNMFQKKL